MASVPTAHLVIFVSVILSSAAVAGVVVEGAGVLGESVGVAQSEYAKDVSTTIAIINDPGAPAASYNGTSGELTIYVKNVGGRIVPADATEITVLVNGTRRPVVGVTVLDDTKWRPGVVVELTVEAQLPGNAETRVLVVVSGDRARYEFTTA